MECLVCLEDQKGSEICISVDSENWQEYRNIIDKHLWVFETPVVKACICSPCWEVLSDFNTFYTRVESTHNARKLKLKNETDPLQEDNKPKDILLKTLLEPEIVICQKLETPIEIKQENEEPIIALAIAQDNFIKDADYNSIDILYDDHDPPFIADSSDTKESYDDTDSDDNLPLIRMEFKNNKPPTRNERRKSAKETDENPKPFKGKNTSKLKSTSIEKRNTPRKQSNLPKINRVEYDKFLQENFKMTCDKCQKTFDRFRILCQHYIKEHNEEGYALCCGNKFFNRRLLVDHINYHLNPEYFKCDLCNKVFTKRICLIGHMKMHEEKKFCCDICDKKFVLKHKLDKHKLTHLPESEKKFPCNECGKFYANEYILTQHQKAVHLNIYAKICEICGQTMPDSHTFKRHMERHEGIFPVKNAKCDQCGLILTSQHTLKLHIELKHPTDRREHKCHVCSKISPNLRALNKHVREAHEMGYRFKCTICEKEFKRADNFKSHMAIHTGTPLHRCPWCPKEFNSNGNMHQHRKKAHPIEWEEAQRKKYSGNLPPNFKRPSTSSNSQNQTLTADINQQ
ncbi:transcription factor grauzone [Stomoxys calcitrans]|uniref:transcription factor grauzone n=1 Tax=Stomoxys calcitrans TaxID=35570 RepID=UPI0027E39462|nr:transcription factor grauzone [Stomoxys calcitrans]XP_013111783.2 transcription factor grauzone [Stomoxys calcitrans]